jgi:hypothetical protein
VVAKALQRYGMVLAEGGPKALTARGDRSTTARWAGSSASTISPPQADGLRRRRRRRPHPLRRRLRAESLIAAQRFARFSASVSFRSSAW